jgi:signal transduction histidine kinase
LHPSALIRADHRGDSLVTISHSAARPTVDAVLDILSSPDDRDLSEIVELAASICSGDAAGITIRRDDEYHVPITHGITPFVCAAQETFCALTMGTDGLFTVEDARADSRFADIGFVDGRLARARFYASAPIHEPGGEMVGRLCVIGEQPRRLTDLQVRALSTLGLSVSKLIELRLLRAFGHADRAPRRDHDASLLAQLTLERNHDLKVPLTGIVAGLEMLRDRDRDRDRDGADPYVRVLLDRCTSAAWRMNRMLDRDLTEAAAGASRVVHTDLGHVAVQVLDGTATLLERVGATVEVGDLPVVHADADAMYSVVQNLLSNSVKFARPGVPARVRIGAKPDDDGWRISVVDNGIGIPQERRTDVFTLFGRAATDVEGHGIGLATVARIVTLHGGRVGVDDAPDGGTEIWFTLPAA